MPRWLVAFLLAFVLSCCGFAAAAQVCAGSAATPDGVLVQDALSAGDAVAADTDDGASDLSDAGSDLTEFLTGPRPLMIPAVAAPWPPRATPPSEPSPPLERPKRPPRGTAFPV
jgi:hypothetical protein